jgi:hypothetical protein
MLNNYLNLFEVRGDIGSMGGRRKIGGEQGKKPH